METDSIGLWGYLGPKKQEEYSGVLDCLNLTYQRLKETNASLGLPAQEWGIAMREEIFKALLEVGAAFDSPPRVVLDSESLPVFFSHLIPITPIDTAGAKGQESDIYIRPLEELQEGWMPWS